MSINNFYWKMYPLELQKFFSVVCYRDSEGEVKHLIDYLKMIYPELPVCTDIEKYLETQRAKKQILFLHLKTALSWEHINVLSDLYLDNHFIIVAGTTETIPRICISLANVSFFTHYEDSNKYSLIQQITAFDTSNNFIVWDNRTFENSTRNPKGESFIDTGKLGTDICMYNKNYVTIS